MKNKAAFVAIVMVLSLVAGVGIAKITGYWKTEGRKVPMKISQGEFEGESDPGDIRGSYSFADIEAAFGIPSEMTAAAFGMPGDDPGQMKAKNVEETWGEMEGGVEVGTDSIKLFTALWIGLPHDAEETSVLPTAAVEILEAYQRIDAAQAAELRLTAVALPNAVGGEAVPAESDQSDDHEIPDRMVRGFTTFGDLKGWGVTEEMWQEKFDKSMGSRSTSIKDWAEDTGIPMSEIKSLAQDMVDSGA